MARLFHTSDWHVGKSLRGVSRTPDHDSRAGGDRRSGPRSRAGSDHPFRRRLRRAAACDRRSAPRARARSTSSARSPRRWCWRATTIPGRCSRCSRCCSARARGCGSSPRPAHPLDGGIVEVPARDGTRLRLAPVPFVHANRQVDWFGDPQRFMAVYATRMQLINDILREGLEDGFDPARDVLLYAAHLHVSGAHLSGSERLVHVSETYAAESAGLPVVSYSALGHIHKPQQVPGRDAFYVGSPMQLDYGEAGEAKSSIVVELLPGRPAEVQRLPLSSGRGLLELRGSFEQIAARAPEVEHRIAARRGRERGPDPRPCRRAHRAVPQRDARRSRRADRLAHADSARSFRGRRRGARANLPGVARALPPGHRHRRQDRPRRRRSRPCSPRSTRASMTRAIRRSSSWPRSWTPRCRLRRSPSDATADATHDGSALLPHRADRRLHRAQPGGDHRARPAQASRACSRRSRTRFTVPRPGTSERSRS